MLYKINASSDIVLGYSVSQYIIFRYVALQALLFYITSCDLCISLYHIIYHFKSYQIIFTHHIGS